jgi:hypothetical protein
VIALPDFDPGCPFQECASRTHRCGIRSARERHSRPLCGRKGRARKSDNGHARERPVAAPGFSNCHSALMASPRGPNFRSSTVRSADALTAACRQPFFHPRIRPAITTTPPRASAIQATQPFRAEPAYADRSSPTRSSGWRPRGLSAPCAGWSETVGASSKRPMATCFFSAKVVLVWITGSNHLYRYSYPSKD